MAHSPKHTLLDNLAAAALAGPWSRKELLERFSRATGNRWRWRLAAVRLLLKTFGMANPPADVEDVVRCLMGLPGRLRARLDGPVGAGCEYFWAVPRMKASAWAVPPLATTAAVAHWLGVSVGQLDWFADIQNRNADDGGRLCHYRHRWVAKRGGRFRLLEIPKARLKTIQRRILSDILNHVPAHDAAHAFRGGRSAASYVAPHVGQPIVLRFDLCDFFPSVPASRVHALFATLGYPRDVARVLTGLCTTAVPSDVWHARPGGDAARWGLAWQRLRSRHLPQGAPTSPALANLCAFRLDRRLTALAHRAGAAYTRYADDLAFSGGEQRARCARRFQVAVGRIAGEEGFELNYRKSRFMRRGVRQHLAGVVLNERPNVPRAEYDTLKAILTNCGRRGPAGENRDGRADFRAYLRGRIAHVSMIHPCRGAKLMRLFDAVAWPAAAE